MDYDKGSTFLKLGLNKAESETLTALLQYPHGVSVLELSRELNLPRPTIYSHLETLLWLGVIKKGLRENASVIYPESKEIIEKVFDEKIHELRKTKNQFSLSFDVGVTHTKFKPKFFLFEDQNSYQQVWRDILITKKETYWIWPIKGMLEKGVSAEQLKDFHEERIQRGIVMNVLWSEKTKLDIHTSSFLGGKGKQSLRNIRILPKGFEPDVGYGIYGNKVAFISSGSEKYSFVIESKELAQTLKNQFDFFWKNSRKYFDR